MHLPCNLRTLLYRLSNQLLFFPYQPKGHQTDNHKRMLTNRFLLILNAQALIEQSYKNESKQMHDIENYHLQMQYQLLTNEGIEFQHLDMVLRAFP